MPDKLKIGVISLGCSKNRVDTELMLAQLKDEYTFVGSLEEADIALINTCAFTNEAREESLDQIMEAEQLKKFSNLKGIVVTGCLPQRFKNKLYYSVPRVDALLGTAAYKDIREALKAVEAGEKYDSYADRKFPEYTPDRLITTMKPTAYVRISEGCENECSYCVIPQIRGGFQSRTMEDILGEIEKLAKDGYSEIILIAQDSTKYGIDLYGEGRLPELMDKAAQIPGITWLRVLYCYPDGVTDELLDVMERHDNIPNYIDMPVQHMVDEVLTAMNRKNTYASTMEVVKRIRDKSPDFIIRTTIMVGFPGTDRAASTLNLKRVKEAQFDRLGVFAYSQEEDTPAAKMEGQVDEAEKSFRKDTLMSSQSQVSLGRNKARVGTRCKVLIEGVADQPDMYYGRSYAELPEVDGKVLIKTKEQLEVGQYYDVDIVQAYNYDLVGELAE